MHINSTDLYHNPPVPTDLDTPDYMVTFSGIICTLLTLQMAPEQVRLLVTVWVTPSSQVDLVIPQLMDAFNLPEDIRAFIFDQYLPEVTLPSSSSPNPC